MTTTAAVVRFPGYGEDVPLEFPAGVGGTGVVSRFRDGTMARFLDTLAAVGNCAHPVRLVGSSTTIDRHTGEVLGSFSSADTPLGVLYRPCGNRREAVCPPCSRVYARDTYALIAAGVEGGKTAPERVADNPLLFVTLTAPSFGPVHTASRAGQRCHPRAREPRCRHGRPGSCMTRHGEEDPQVGAPLCADCYDYPAAVLWQWHAPELWRRFTIALRRSLAAQLGLPDARLAEVASVQYAKVAEYQTRGMIHFHALIRLDGPAAAGIGSPAPAAIDGAILATLVKAAAAAVTVRTEPVDDDDPQRLLGFGTQVDVRVVRAGSRTDDPTGPLTPGQVAGYLAKYATKDATTLPSHDRSHLAAMRRHTQDLAARAAAHHPREHPYRRMRRWVHALGFRGHFATKSRRYSTTLGALRRARRRWQQLAADSRRTGCPIDTRDLDRRLLADEDDTTLVVGSWAYLGTGWRDSTEEALALAAAARAREHAQWQARTRRTDEGRERA